MCGPTGAQQQLQQEQMDFYQQGQQEAKQTFGEQQGILQQLESVYEPILAKGPNAKGFSQAEEQDLNATAVDQTAQNYARAAKVAGEQIASEGGGNVPGGTTGSQEQLREEVAAASAQQESTEESQIKQSNYAAGREEFAQATGALATASGQLSPVSYENAATEAGGAAATTANEIAQENNSWINAAIGAAGSIGSSVVDMNPGGIFG